MEMDSISKGNKRMDRWVPLLQIFLNSPTPERDASLWIQHQHHHHAQSTPHNPTSAFLSLLQTPTPALQTHSSSSSPPLIWIQTLPPATQTRILSFLAAERHRFCRRRLRSLSAHILRSTTPTAFWVHRAARHLFDTVSSSDLVPFDPLQEEDRQQRQQHQNQGVEESKEVEFNAMPHWLQCHASTTTSLLPWLPLPPTQIPKTVPPVPVFLEERPKSMDSIAEQAEPCPHSRPEPSVLPSKPPLDSQARNKASALNADLLTSDSADEALRLSREIQKLCVASGAGNQLKVLGLIEPWEADDETASVLLSHLSGNDELDSIGWPAHILCSVALPKLLFLQNPASRVLLSATISFCKLHQTAAVKSLLFPLLLLKQGINVHHHDVISRIIKECLHPSHVSAFCQRLLCWEGEDRSLVCLPCHSELIADEVVWTEPVFTLFQHILNQGVHLTPDTIDRLVSVIGEMARKFSKSLKFGNFLLCFVTNCPRASSFHKLSLERAAKKTDTFMTKSVLSKLGDW